MEPKMRLIHDSKGQEFWVVEGLGMTFIHRQRWQAEVKLHCLQSSVGGSTGVDRPLGQPSNLPGA